MNLSNLFDEKVMKSAYLLAPCI